MIYKPEHVVDLETGAIVDVALNLGDQHDAKGLAARVVAAAARATGAVGEVARVETVVADMGYCDAAELGTLQAAGIRTAIADPVRNRLFFRRFLNEDLTAVPDIDLDFARDIREKLILRVYERFGCENAALVASFPTYRMRSAIRDVGKALGIAESELGRLAKRAG